MAVKANAQGIVYAGLTDGYKMSVAYKARGRVGYIPSYAECERGAGIGHKHRWNLHATIGGNDRCRDMQRNNLWNEVRGWKHLFEIHSLPDEPMDVPHYVLAYHIGNTAEKIHDSNACLPKGVATFIRVFAWLNIIALAVLSIVLTVIAPPAGVIFGTLLITAASVGFSYLDSWGAAVQSLDFSAEWKTNDLSKQLDKAKVDQAKKTANITNTLCFQPQAMFPTGSLYESGKAGSESYCPSAAYDANKGILGEQDYKFVDEFMQNRAQVNQAAGINFMNHTLGFDFSLKQIEAQNLAQAQITLQNQTKEWNMRINSFVSALARQGFFMASGGSSMGADKLYEHLINSHIKRKQRAFCTIAMIDALKNYNRGLRYKVPTMMSDFDLKLDTKAKFVQNFDALYGGWESSLDTYKPLEAQALDFVDFAKQILAQVSNFKNASDKCLSLNLNSANFINARLKHSGDKAFSYNIKQINNIWNTQKPSFAQAIEQIGYDINVYAGSSPKIPPFVASNVFVVWGWVWKDIDLSKYFKATEVKNAVYKEKDIYVLKLNYIVDESSGGSE